MWLLIDCVEGDVRPLIGGAATTEGFVEVCVGGRYLAVSPDAFTIAEANVLCRQLNLGTGSHLRMLSYCMYTV